MRGRTILVAGITAALLGGSGIAYSDLRDDGSHVHVTNSMDSPVPTRTDNPLPRETVMNVGAIAANDTICRNLSSAADGPATVTSISAYVRTTSKPTVVLSAYSQYSGRYLEGLPVTQSSSGSWGAHWTGEIPFNLPARTSSNEGIDPVETAPFVTIQICVKNPTDPITSFSGIGVVHPLP